MAGQQMRAARVKDAALTGLMAVAALGVAYSVGDVVLACEHWVTGG